jgi:DNA-binding transcriptional ArsR family regulator
MSAFRPLDALRAVRDLREISALKKAVLFALIMRADDRGECWPSYATIAVDSGLSVRSVMRIIPALYRDGLLDVEHRREFGKHEQTSNLYRLKVVTQSHNLVTHGHEVVTDDHHLVTESQGGSDTRSPQVVTGGHPGSDRVSPDLPIDLPNGTAQLTALALTSDESAASRAPKGRKGDRRKPETPAPPSDATAEEIEAWCKHWTIRLPWKHDQAARFIDHARANDRRCRDWGAAWRNWQRNAPQFAPETKAEGKVSYIGNPNPVSRAREPSEAEIQERIRQAREEAAGQEAARKGPREWKPEVVPDAVSPEVAAENGAKIKAALAAAIKRPLSETEFIERRDRQLKEIKEIEGAFK